MIILFTTGNFFAVLYAEKLIAEQPDNSIISEAPKKVYTQDWAAYNKSQIEEKDTFLKLLAELVDTCQNRLENLLENQDYLCRT